MIGPRICEYCGKLYMPDRRTSRFCTRTCAMRWVTLTRKPRTKIPLADRLWAKVDKSNPDGCWPFTGHINRLGYGALRSEGIKLVSAHRAAYAVTYGPIPDGMAVCHSCDNPACCRPDHLFLATQLENISDRDHKRRTAVGSRHASAKLTEADVVAIRAAMAAGISGASLSRQYGVADHTISQIRTGKTWRHVP